MIGDSLRRTYIQQRNTSSGILQKPQRLLDNDECKRLSVKGSLQSWKDKMAPTENIQDVFFRNVTPRPLSNRPPSSIPSDSPNNRTVQNINQYLNSPDRRNPNLLNQRDPTEYQRPRNVINPNAFPARAPMNLQNAPTAEYVRSTTFTNLPHRNPPPPPPPPPPTQQQQQRPANTHFPTSQSTGVLQGNNYGWPNNIPVQLPQFTSAPQYLGYMYTQDPNQQRFAYANPNIAYSNQPQATIPRPMFSLPSLQLQAFPTPQNLAAYQHLTGVSPQWVGLQGPAVEGGGWTRGNVTYVPAHFTQPDGPGVNSPPLENNRSCSLATMPWVRSETRYITPRPGAIPEPPVFRPMNASSGGDSSFNPEPPCQAYCRQYEKFKRF